MAEQSKTKHEIVYAPEGTTAEVWTYPRGQRRECHVEIVLPDQQRVQVKFITRYCASKPPPRETPERKG